MTDYAIEIADTTLDTIITGLEGRFLKYTSATRRGSNLVIPYKHGELFVPDKYFASSDVLLELFLPSALATDGAEALSELALLFSNQGLVKVKQTDPHRGDIRAMVEQTTDPIPTQNSFVYMFGLALPSGFWEDVTLTNVVSANPPVVTTSGDRPIDDMVLTYAGTGFLEHTDSLGEVSRVTVETGAGGTTPYTVDVGAGTIVDAVGATKDDYLLAPKPWWMKFQPGVAQSFTSNVAVAVDYRNKWS